MIHIDEIVPVIVRGRSIGDGYLRVVPHELAVESAEVSRGRLYSAPVEGGLVGIVEFFW